MNGDIVKEIDDYIAAQYMAAYEQNRGSKEIPYYKKLAPFAYIMLRSEILLDYARNQDTMPERAEEILSGKTLARIVEKYEIEKTLKTITYSITVKRLRKKKKKKPLNLKVKVPSFVHRSFDGIEADWVLVAVWLWIERREKEISPKEFFSGKNVYEASRLYIINRAEMIDNPEFDDYFKGADYKTLVDRYDISKDKLDDYVSNRDLIGLGKELRSRFDADSEKNDDQHRSFEKKLKELWSKVDGRPDVDSNKPGKSAAIRALNKTIDDIDANWKNKALTYRRIDDKDCYVIAERASQMKVINLIRDIRKEMNLNFTAKDLRELLRREKRNGKTGTIEIETLSLNTIENYLKPSSEKVAGRKC